MISIQPVLGVEDLGRAIAYYRDALGFDLAWSWGEPVSRVGVERDRITIQLLADPNLRPEAPGQLYCEVHGVEAYYRECVGRGARVVLALGPRPWGMTDFRVVDPSGNQLGFGEVIAPEEESRLPGRRGDGEEGSRG